MTETNGSSPQACPSRLNDLKTFAEKSEASEDFIQHVAGCQACRAAVDQAHKQKEADIKQAEADITKAEEDITKAEEEVTKAEENLDNLQDKLGELEDNLGDMESVIGDIDNWVPDEEPEVKPQLTPTAGPFGPFEQKEPTEHSGLRGLRFVLLGLIVLIAAIYASVALSKQAEARDWRLARQVRDTVKPVLPDPINLCHADHWMLCQMTGNQDACAAASWYKWIPWPAPTKVVCPVDAHFGFQHPDRPNFYVIEGNTAVAYRICGEAAPSDCPRPAKELGRISLPSAVGR